MKRVAWLVVCSMSLGLLSPKQAHAIAPICVHHNDSAGLASALAGAVSSGLGATIEVEQGTYVVPPTGWVYVFSPRQDIALLGGYVQGTNCQQRHITASPNTPSTNTILDGQSQNGAIIAIELQGATPANLPYGTLTFEGFEVRNLQTTSNGPNGTGLFVVWDVFDGFNGGIVFRYNWVHNVISSGKVVELHTAGPMTFDNNLLDQNIGTHTAYLLSAQYNAAPWRIVNNTIANNTGEGLVVDQSGTYVQLFNNILYANTSFDLDAVGSFVELHADTYFNSTNSLFGNISNHGYAFAGTNPGYDPTTFHLLGGSGSINSGAAYAGVLPAQDLDGNARWVGSNPDRGAFESNVSDQAYWLVTSAADSSHASDSTVNCNPGSTKCTLREAITRANASGPSLIAFHLTGSCGPQVILLGSPLPDINNAIAIDGFSQPGAVMNTLAFDSGGGLNATLCIVIEGIIANNVSSALIAAPTDFGAQLDVRGVMFEGFTGPAVSLSANSYHWVHGNAFGIETDANPFVFGNAAGVLLGGGATFSTVGGNAPADSNVFGRMNDASKAAITLSSSANGHFGHSVVGNLVGVDGGYTVHANQGAGLHVQNSSNHEIRNNSFVANAMEGISLSAANSNWLHDNNIGALPQEGVLYASTLSNGGSGIALSNGAANNAIGGFDKTAYQIGYSNTIQNNKGPGVWIRTGAGTGNSVLSNHIGANGPNGSAGGDFAIDIGALGTAAGTNPDSVDILQSYMLGYQTFMLNFIVAGKGGDAYRVDFYLNNDTGCDAGGYGPAEIPIQTYSFTMPGAGMQFQGVSVQLPVFGIFQMPSYVTAAATNLASGTTSQISNCALLKNDRIFIDGFESQPISAG